MTVKVCVEPDIYLGQYCDKNCIWIVELSNGQTVFQDDSRPDVYPESAWIRLKQYCKNENVYIDSMRLQFRSNEIDIGSGADGYYFCKGVSAFMTTNITNHLYIAGILDNDVVRVSRWKVPELIKEGTELRNPDLAGDCLISKYGKKQKR